jgi:hypothetical protein
MDNITKNGQAVQVVYLTKDSKPGDQPFMYTIDNYHLGLPELLIVDTDKDIIAGVRIDPAEQGRAIDARAFDPAHMVIGRAQPRPRLGGDRGSFEIDVGHRLAFMGRNEKAARRRPHEPAICSELLTFVLLLLFERGRPLRE